MTGSARSGTSRLFGPVQVLVCGDGGDAGMGNAPGTPVFYQNQCCPGWLSLYWLLFMWIHTEHAHKAGNSNISIERNLRGFNSCNEYRFATGHSVIGRLIAFKKFSLRPILRPISPKNPGFMVLHRLGRQWVRKRKSPKCDAVPARGKWMDYSAVVSEENAMNEQVLRARLRAFGIVRAGTRAAPKSPSSTALATARISKPLK